MLQEEITQQSILLQLPSEILELIIHKASIIPQNNQNQIVSWQYPEHSCTRLQNMALTCRKLYILCAPYLWRDKEFILPAEDHEPTKNSNISMATDILSEKTIVLKQPMQYHLGGYVRSLYRDLTNNPNYDLTNSSLMAHLVHNLKALRIDFHPKPRMEQYGLCYFSEHCMSLTEIYLENCRDTFDDFYSLIKYNRQLESITLVSCTIKADTLVQLSNQCKKSLKSLILQQIWIEPSIEIEPESSSPSNNISYTPMINNLTTSYLHSKKITFVSLQLYTQVLTSNYYLTLLVLSDSINLETLNTVINGSPYLERMTISLHERYPPRVTNCLLLISNLKYLTLLSLAFRYISNTELERLPCCVPSIYWTFLLDQLNHLQFIHVSATQILLNNDFMNRLTTSSISYKIKNVMLHHIAMVPITTITTQTTLNMLKCWKKQQFILTDHHHYIMDIVKEYENDHLMAQNNVQSWQSSYNWNNIKQYVVSLEEAEKRGYGCFDHLDKVCFIKGFDDWLE